jgi:hypothetical protein
MIQVNGEGANSSRAGPRQARASKVVVKDRSSIKWD